MNKVYESETMVVHDDREPITILLAIDLLMGEKTIHICDPPDYSAEHESEIFDTGRYVSISDFIEGDRSLLTEDEVGQILLNFLHGYEISL